MIYLQVQHQSRGSIKLLSVIVLLEPWLGLNKFLVSAVEFIPAMLFVMALITYTPTLDYKEY
jgi:hypothetical protein